MWEACHLEILLLLVTDMGRMSSECHVTLVSDVGRMSCGIPILLVSDMGRMSSGRPMLHWCQMWEACHLLVPIMGTVTGTSHLCTLFI